MSRLGRYIANGNMYGRSYTFSSPYSNMLTEPFKVSVSELYSFMLKRHLDKSHGYGVNLLSVVLDNDTYYFNDLGVIRSIGKYESS